MSGYGHLRTHVKRDVDPQDEFEGIRSSIEFLRDELGLPANELGRSIEDARRELADLVANVEPPTDNQKLQLASLLQQTGGVMTGRLYSKGQYGLLIEELQMVRREQRKKQLRDPAWIVPIAVILAFCLLLLNWPAETIAWMLLLAIPVLVFLGIKVFR